MKKLLTLFSAVGLTATAGATLVSCTPEKDDIDKWEIKTDEELISSISNLKRSFTNSEAELAEIIAKIDVDELGAMTFLEIKKQNEEVVDRYISLNADLIENRISALVFNGKVVTFDNDNQAILTNLESLEKEDRELYVSSTFSDVFVMIHTNDQFEGKILSQGQVKQFHKMANMLRSKFPDESTKYEIVSKLAFYENNQMIFANKYQKLVKKYKEEIPEAGSNLFLLKDVEREFVQEYVSIFNGKTLYEVHIILNTEYVVAPSYQNLYDLYKKSETETIKKIELESAKNLVNQIEEFLEIEEARDFEYSVIEMEQALIQLKERYSIEEK